MQPAPYALAEDLELALGDPRSPATVFSEQRCMELDAAELFPTASCRVLDDWGLPEYYVPAEHGGALENYEQLLQLMRTVARRDLTVAIGHGKTYLGAVCVWVAGTAAQAARVGAEIRALVPVSLGLTERGHGSDLLAGEVRASLDRTEWVLDGEKWLINNATRGQLLSVLARTEAAGGPRGFSVLLVDKRELRPLAYHCRPKIPTHGIRGADISGIVFTEARVPQHNVVGPVGGGVEIVVKALQLTRTMCASLSLGAADHGLDVALDFAEERELYGRRLIALPQARSLLARAAADMLLNEALTITASRAVHALTDEMSLVSAITKYFVPTTTDDVLAALTRVLGARAFLKDVHAHGAFQKIERDHRIVGLFDGNTLVNLSGLISQFRSLVRSWDRRDGTASAGSRLTFDLTRPLPPLDMTRLSLVARRDNSTLTTLPHALAELRSAASRHAELAPALALAEELGAAAETVHDQMLRYSGSLTDVPFEAFEVAKRYCALHAGVAATGVYLANHEAARFGSTAELWTSGQWLAVALDRALDRIDSNRAGLPAATYDEFLDTVRALRENSQLVSLVPFTRAGSSYSPPVEHWGLAS